MLKLKTKIMKKTVLKLLYMTSFYSMIGVMAQMFFLNLACAIDSDAQPIQSVKEVSVKIKSKNTRVIDIFREIERKTDFKFVYDKKDNYLLSQVDISPNKMTIERHLLQISRQTKLSFRQVNNSISVNLQRNKLHQEIEIIIQKRNITGKITSDEDPEGLPGVNVLLKGSATGTVTDVEGKYSLDVTDDENAILVFSSVGYMSEEILIGNKSIIDLNLAPDITSLSEIVVIGYGTQEKRNVSGSIASVDSKILEQTQSPSFDASLQGRVPGVYVTTNGGQPGGGVYVRIRGAGTINNSNPLYVVDGIIIPAGNSENSNPLATINPNDIESIDILKDAASSAIYGARAANGVVLITTKKGKSGKPTLTYSGYYGIQQLASKLDRPMNAREFAENMNAAFEASGDPIPFPNPSTLGEGTNWLDEGTQTGSITDHQLSISGGTEFSKYYVSMNYFDNQGVMLDTYQKRLSFRVNTENKIGKVLKIGNTLMYSRSSQLNNNAGNRDFIHGVFTTLYQMLPTVPVYDNDLETSSTGYGGPTDVNLERQRNLISQRVRPTRENSSDRILGSVYADLTLFKGLTFRSTISVDIRRESNYFYEASWREGLLNSNGLSSQRHNRNSGDFWQWDNVLNYTNSIGDHNFSVILGTSAQESKFTSLNSSASYDTDVFTQLVVGGAVSSESTSTLVRESLASIFGRVTYDYKSKYLLTAAVRRDGSSKFGPTNKFGVFPSFTAGWRISDEEFIQSGGFISDLKIRGGWGQVGSDAIGNFRYLATLNSTYDYAFGNQTAVSSLGVALKDLANPNVQWETATEYNFGVDAAFLDGRLNFSAEYYNKTNTNMLFVLDLPGTSGLETTVDNVGEVLNSGLEFALGFRKTTGDFQYDFNANLTTINSEVIDLAGKEEIVAFTYSGSGATVVIREGLPLGSFLTRRTLGIFQTQAEVDAANAMGDPTAAYQNILTAPGDWKWKDLDGDGQITSADKEITGSPIPKFTYGFGAMFQYKMFDMNFQFFGVYGNDILNVNRSQLEASGRAYNKSSTVVNAWSGEGTSNTIPRPNRSDPNQNIILSDHLVEDGSFMRLKTMQIGFNFPHETISKLGLSAARIYVSGQNLFVLTKFSGGDPEVGLVQNSSAAAGIYNDLYPQVRNLSLGINLTF